MKYLQEHDRGLSMDKNMTGHRSVLSGIGASRGIGIGRAVILKEPKLIYEHRRHTDVEQEEIRYSEAVKELVAQTEILTREAEHGADILKAQIALLRDPLLNEAILEQIRDGAGAEDAVDNVCNRYIELFSGGEDELLRERSADLRDLKERILMKLLGQEEIDLSAIPEGSVIITKELTPSMTLKMNGRKVAGIVTEKGGSTSHAAILSRSMEIPAVLSVSGICESVRENDPVIVDGFEGKVLIFPEEKEEERYRRQLSEYRERKEPLRIYRTLPTVYADGSRRKVLCNIGSPEDMKQVLENGGEGVGLFRTEYLYMNRSDLPSEAEQEDVYRRVLSEAPGEVIIRTLDIGGDKAAEALSMPKEANPNLGMRAIRFSLMRKDLFRVQLRALLRSSVSGDLKILLPMVTSREEILEVRSLIRQEQAFLREEGIPYAERIPLGIMAETPASVLMADALCRVSDFVSIGTNDLTQYLMSADRGDPRMDHLNSVYQPALIRSIHAVILGAEKAGISVGMCGEAASNEDMIPLLLGLGLSEFSVSPVRVPEVRARIAEEDPEKCTRLAEKALTLESEEEVRDLLFGKRSS